jgi:signal transduction histidine kinase
MDNQANLIEDVNVSSLTKKYFSIKHKMKLGNLVPEWTHHYDEFWQAIRRRNLWLIKLRYGAVLLLLVFINFVQFVLRFDLSSFQYNALFILSGIILLYNIFLHWIRRFLKPQPYGFNPLHLALLQMLFDLTALVFLFRFTGGAETPICFISVFHIVIGSLILPGFVIYSIAGLVVITFSLLIYFEYYSQITHYHISGLASTHLVYQSNYVLLFLMIFSFVIFTSVLIANWIAKQLYKREQQLYNSIDQLNAAEIQKQKYIVGIIHEIKTPIAAIQSYLDLVLQKFVGPLNEKVEAKLERAKIRTDEAIRLTNNILKISRMKLQDEIIKEEIDIKQVVDSLVFNVVELVRQKDISITVDDHRSRFKKFSGDKFLIEIAISNLIGNAVKYVGSEGSIVISVDDNDNGILLKICDNGIGIPQKDKDKIFTQFYRASNIPINSFEGVGLGLSVVKEVVDKHNGTISFESPSSLGSKERPGTCFIIFFPY